MNSEVDIGATLPCRKFYYVPISVHHQSVWRCALYPTTCTTKLKASMTFCRIAFRQYDVLSNERFDWYDLWVIWLNTTIHMNSVNLCHISKFSQKRLNSENHFHAQEFHKSLCPAFTVTSFALPVSFTTSHSKIFLLSILVTIQRYFPGPSTTQKKKVTSILTAKQYNNEPLGVLNKFSCVTFVKL